jgi:hypothetical protein
MASIKVLMVVLVVLCSGCILFENKEDTTPNIKVYISSTTSTTQVRKIKPPNTTTTLYVNNSFNNTIPNETTSTTSTSMLVTTTTLKALTPQMEKELLNLKTFGETIIYQAGYFDCKDEVLTLLDIKNRSKFKERPRSTQNLTKRVYTDNEYCYLSNDTNWIVLNHTQADFTCSPDKLLIRPLKVKLPTPI